jgi:diaminopimelate epimerase
MDYRNSDGSFSEMCGNGIRLFVRYLVDEGLADGSSPIRVDTRDGVKTLTVDGDLITVDLGTPKVLGETTVGVQALPDQQSTWAARHIDVGNPHAVAFVSSLDEPGPLLEPPTHDPAIYPDGVNVEFVVRRGDRHVAMRVHERGSGETRSCGTGACAVMVAAAVADGGRPEGEDLAYRVDVPGGTLTVTWTADDRVLLTGPAVVVARGTTTL